MKRPVPALIPVLILVSALFIAILVFAYVETKKANPQMIEVGQALCACPGQAHSACPTIRAYL